MHVRLHRIDQEQQLPSELGKSTASFAVLTAHFEQPLPRGCREDILVEVIYCALLISLAGRTVVMARLDHTAMQLC